MTPYQAFEFAAAIYSPIKPGIFKQVIIINDWTVGYAIDQDGNTVFAIDGTQKLQDFIDDVEALPINAGPLGMVHAGFYRDAPSVFLALQPFMHGNISIVGHSLGAGRAPLLAGLCAIHDIPVMQLWMFEPPRAGFAQLGELVRAHVPYILATRNARDVVPDLPPPFPIPYQHIVELIDLDNPAHSLDPIDDHLLVQVGEGILKRWPEPARDPT